MGSLAEHEPHVAPIRRSPGPMCGVRRYAAQLDQDDADALVRLVYQRLDLDAVQVVDLLAEHGIDLDKEVIKRHRQGRCRKCREE